MLDELIDAVFVLERVTYLADRAGVFHFDLKKVLEDFLNDVQVITEFKRHRTTILEMFDEVMKTVSKQLRAKNAEIYVIGHSEGSVVALLGLLGGLSKDPQPDWIHRVRGLMTIGSSIETHYILWPELWGELKPSAPPKALAPPAEGAPIKGASIIWRNYYDYGDPIAYGLDRTKQWITSSQWMGWFDFEEFAFGRYPFPGKAHVEYWKDREVFGHFIQNVVEPSPPKPEPEASGASEAAHPNRNFTQPPANCRLAQTISYVLPYFLFAALLFLAVYLGYKPVSEAIAQAERERQEQGDAGSPNVGAPDKSSGATKQRTEERTAGRVFRNVSGLALLLAGITVMVRVPRLTSRGGQRLIAWVVFLIALGSYFLLVSPETREQLNKPFVEWTGTTYRQLLGNYGFLIAVAIVVLIARWWSVEHPSRGVRPLLIPGGVLALLIIVWLMVERAPGASIWPVILGSAAFLYLWWLATLLFDLVFVWHQYVRYGKAVQTMDRMTSKQTTKTTISESESRE